MRIPVIRGVIERRILANYRADPDVVARLLPPPFRPKLAHGYSIVGICLIRLNNIRPRFLPWSLGLRTENAAHRIAVEWDHAGRTFEGVYVPRRDTNSRLHVWAGGTLFPGIQHRAKFTVVESDEYLSVALQSTDGVTRVHVSGSVAHVLPTSSVFGSMDEASKYFETGALGYSATRAPGRFDGLELRCDNWAVDALNVDRIESSFFQDESRFPKGSVEFDSALLMRNIHHEWHGRDDLCCAVPSAHHVNESAPAAAP